MKILTFYSDTHKYLYKDFFLKSFDEHLSDHKLIAKYIDQLSPSGNYGSDGFGETMMEKITHIIDNINIEDNEPMVFADCDIQFFDDIKEDLGDYDIKFQDDVSCICAGFFICKQNERVLDFFKLVLSMLNSNMTDGKMRKGLDDQVIINSIIKQNNTDLKTGLLPRNKYFTIASVNGTKRWNGETNFEVPGEIVIHHANNMDTIYNKEKLMRLVKRYVNEK